MAAGSKFPLLQLPHKALLRTLRIMDLYHILKFSLISERCKDLVISVQIKGASFDVFIGKTIKIYAGPVGISDFTFYSEPDIYWGMGAYGRKKKLTAPQSVLVKRSGKRRAKKWRKNVLTMKECELWIELDNTDDHHALISLDELLLINSKVITAENLRLTPKQLNKFIKLWQQGANPRMEVLSIYFQNDEEGDEEIFMKGIKHQVIPADQSRDFKSAGREDILAVEGGMDFHRIDGVKATIVKDSFYSQWFMYVWFDHCVMES
ncbi:hypothetical protein CAEBREN_26180 [Caenorhabditis brenneri]|uniref:F-box domain-containing protein n=1 Tax=Caenorhabditis brenneri TaxID=135651 RepID=G0N0F6_CAEBE|nr:hypothetical protein CAEBREN_26180 [Caenorhabditis brenneri]